MSRFAVARPLAFCSLFLGGAAALLPGVPGLAEEKVTITIQSDAPAAVTTQIVSAEPAPPFVGQRPAVDVAILLDTSNSMDGLIDQAKRQLWTIVNQFAAAEKRGQTPLLRVALFEYGNTNLPASEGYLRQVVPLTDDLDALSAALFALTTSGGDEYCGQVIDEAVTRLGWSSEPGSYKAVFIAGNEPFTQGGVDYRDSCKRAIEAGIVVNTIHCGAYDAGVSGMWRDGAHLAEGEYLNIDQDRVVLDIETPHDAVIIKLNADLNRTYLWYGQGADGYSANQAAQDDNAGSLGRGVMVKRAEAKSSGAYSNVNRDLVDSLAVNEALLQELEADALPEEMRELSEEERVVYVEAKSAERAALQAKIREATAQRDAFVAAERQRLAEETGDATLGDAVTQAVRKQLVEAGYAVEADNTED